MDWLRRFWYRRIPLSWLKQEREDLFDYKFEVLEKASSPERDAELKRLDACIEDTRREFVFRGIWK